MSLIEWRKEFSVGVPSVDHEHQELVEFINSLHEAMQGKASYEDIVRALGDIYAQISAHFALEERIMREARYAEFAAHKQDHEVLLDELLDIIDAVEEDGSYDQQQLSQGLDRWFSDHFRTHDAKLHRQLG